ncbi:hypothetical protein LCGC14_2396440 [marine sediment metagenome]|uniref:CinA C-terminal domain-containing protein n=1 Tax=marine sediment metagenome TaxID=412755 RepID=A0A0F9CIR0_9ZZZZ
MMFTESGDTQSIQFTEEDTPLERAIVNHTLKLLVALIKKFNEDKG